MTLKASLLSALACLGLFSMECLDISAENQRFEVLENTQ